MTEDSVYKFILLLFYIQPQRNLSTERVQSSSMNNIFYEFCLHRLVVPAGIYERGDTIRKAWITPRANPTEGEGGDTDVSTRAPLR